MKFIAILAFIFFANFTNATSLQTYASIKANEANVRTGPSIKYPIRWQYTKKRWPIKITEEFSNWRKFEDVDGEAGWIHVSLISKVKHVVFNKNNITDIYKKADLSSRVVLKVQKNVIARLIKCDDNQWCKIKLDNKTGWIKSNTVWGV